MKRKFNITGGVITLVIVALGVLAVSIAMNKGTGTGLSVGENLFTLLSGAILSGFICALMHESGHAVCAKKIGFKIMDFKVWFFRWTDINGKYVFSFTLPLYEAGATETVPKTTENLEKRLTKMTLGGLIASFVSMTVGIPALFFFGKIPFFVFCFWATFLPIGAYYFFGNALPMSSEGVLNDGGVIYSVKKNTPEGAVLLAILKIHAELFSGKTPAEIDENYYFSVPQIVEDSPYFIDLLTLRYDRFLDEKDFDNAKKTSDRLLTLEDYMPKPVKNLVYSFALYNACTFDFDEDKADDYTEEIEKYLNSGEDITKLRVKTSYILYVRKEKDIAGDFIEKGLKDALKTSLKGYGRFEEKLFNEMKKDL